MGTEAFLSELETLISGELEDASARSSGGFVSFQQGRERRARLLEAFPEAVCEVISERLAERLPDLGGTDEALARLLIRLLREEPPREPPSDDDE